MAFRFFTPERGLPGDATGGARRPTSTSAAAAGRRSARPSRTSWALTVLDIKPVGLAGSGGSTPLRLRVAGDPDTLPVRQALRDEATCAPTAGTSSAARSSTAALEDEAPFQSVRRLVEYEDYTLRLLRDAGIPTAAPPTASSRSPPSASTCSSPSSSTARQEIGDAEVDDDGDRPGPGGRPPAVGRRPGPPRHQAGQPAGPRRPGAR